MKKIREINAIKAVGFDFEESVKDLFSILENLHTDVTKIKSILKEKKIMD